MIPQKAVEGPAPYTKIGMKSSRKRQPRAMSISRCIPIPILSGPGSPSPLRPA
jgi:hypothetical protein